MRIEKYKKFEKLEIYWIDSHSGDEGWIKDTDVRPIKKCGDIFTIGYYNCINKDYISLVMAHNFQETWNTCHYFHIPLGCIRKITRIK